MPRSTRSHDAVREEIAMAPYRSVHAFTVRFFPHSSVSLRWVVAAFALLAALCWASPAWAADSAVFASGAGTETDPYLIENAGQLAASSAFWTGPP